MPQEISVLALGMITQPNKMGQYPVGALKTAQDVFIRSPGVIELSKPGVTLNSLSASASKPSEILVPSDAEMVCIDGNSGSGWEVQWFSGSTSNVVSIAAAFLGNGLTNYTRSRDRLIVTSANGPIVFDFAAPTTTAQRSPRLVGLSAPRMSCSVFTGTANALKANTHATCIVLIKRVYADGYELISATSLPVDPGFAVSDGDIQFFVAWTVSPGGVLYDQILAGDVIEAYRTRAQSSGTAGVGGTSCDATYYLTTTHVITSGEASSYAAQFNDSTPDTGLGRQLYTNPGIGGAQATYISPPVAPITVTFKGHTFLFNTTEAAQLELSVLGGIGYAKLADPASWRTSIIGAREFTATWSNGSGTLTGISAAHMVGLRVGQTVRDDAVFGVHFDGGVITAVGASSVTIAMTATGAGTKTFVSFDTMVVDGDTGAYTTIGGTNSTPDLASVQTTMARQLIVGAAAYTGGSNKDSFQAASLAYFSSTFLCAPTPIKFSIAKSRAAPFNAGTTSISVTATNGQNYQPALPEYGTTPLVTASKPAPNGMAWSEAQQPDAWPPANRARVGSGKVLAAAATRDAVWIFCTDGLWRLSGNGGAVGAEGYDWRTDPVDSTLIISGPQALCVLRDTVYAYTGRGFVSVDDNDGIDDKISEGVIGDQLPGASYSNTGAIELRADEDKDEILVIVGNALRVWNYLTKTWVRNTQLTSSGTSSYAYWRVLSSVVMADDAASNARYINSGAAQHAEVTGFVTLQPVYGGDPFATKQWIDATYVFDGSTGGVSTVAEFNGAYTPFFTVVAAVNVDRRVTYGVPRRTPAVAQGLEIGLAFYCSEDGATVAPKMWGIRMRFTVISDQQTRRSV